MKRCPTCQRTYTEETQKFCASDGTPLVIDEPSTPQVIDEPSDFDPEATIISSATKLKEESASSKVSELPPTQYFNPDMVPPAPPESDIHQSYPPPQSSPGGQPPPAWSPAPPSQQQQYQPSPPPQQQQYYPQPGPTGGQPPAPQWQGGQPPPPQYQQQPPWMPGQQQQPQGQQQWGGGHYPQPGQYAPPAGKSLALSLITLIVGVLGFVNWALLFGMWNRIIPPDRSVAEVVVYVMLVFGILAFLLGIATLISSRWRSKALAIVGLVLGLPGIIFFIYLVAENRLP